MKNDQIKIGLGMIVKNEEIDIKACLESFVGSVDHIHIIDTGSTDKTKEIIHDTLKKFCVPYRLVDFLEANDTEGRLCDFSRARNEYVKSLEKTGVDYLMSADADDTLTHRDLRAAIEDRPADFYSIQYRMNPNFAFKSYKIWRNGYGVRYEGRVHENIRVDWKKRVVDLSIEYQHHFTENPNQENGTIRNMRILRAEIYPPLRSLFYWANENIDARNFNEAIKSYLEYIRRAKLGEPHWTIELAHCYFRGARWLQHMGRSTEAVALCYELLGIDPTWSEAWCELAYISKLRGDTDKMKEYCLKALGNKFEPRLFSEADKYDQTPKNMLIEASVKND